MSSYIINVCDVIITLCNSIKQYLDKEQYVLKADLDEIKYLNFPVNFKCSRKNRHLLYKKLKGKNSEFKIYSYGIEDKDTYKNVMIDYIK